MIEPAIVSTIAPMKTPRHPLTRAAAAALALALPACSGDDGRGDSDSDATTVTTTSSTTAGASTAGTADTVGASTGTTNATGASATTTDSTVTSATSDGSTGQTTTSGGSACGEPGYCDQPNQICDERDDSCVTLCQGQDPDPCGPAQVCDVISGECKDAEAACALAGDYDECGDNHCGPGTTCDGMGACIPIAPCFAATCADDGMCWGTGCSCARAHECGDQLPDEDLLNGPFSTEITDLEFADDCTAWMVTLRSGTDYVRRLRPDGELTEWAGVSNLDMGEIKVLKALSIPQSHTSGAGELVTDPPPPKVEGLGEVAITYICCENCGCFVDPPQGVSRLDEDNQQEPLPQVITATVTQGAGPFGFAVTDAGPQGLSWGEDRVLYVGNTTENGEFNSADLEAETVDVLTTFNGRVYASAPISAVHLIVAIEGGDVYRFNTETGESEFVLFFEHEVTGFSHDAFSGLVYTSLANFDIVALDPFTGEFEPFGTMPGVGRVKVSPDGRLWFSPIKYVDNKPITSWDLPDEL